MRILVTGGAGYIGSFTVQALLANGEQVEVLDDLSTGHAESLPPECKLWRINLLDAQAVDDLFFRRHFDAVVHFAAKSLVGQSVKDPLLYYNVNLTGSFNLISAAVRHEVDRFVFSSTAATYGNPQGELNERHPTIPINPYGHTKLAVEHLLNDVCRAHGLRSIALRYFNAAGASIDGSMGEDHTPESHLIPLAIGAALGSRPPLQIFGSDYETIDGTPVRDYIHVLDLAAAHVEALQFLESKPRSFFQPLNVGAGHGITVMQIINKIEELSGRKVPCVQSVRREGDPTILVSNTESIKQTLRWSARHSSIENIIGTALRWHSQNSKGYSATGANPLLSRNISEASL